MLLRDDAIGNVVYGVDGASAEMTALCVRIRDVVFRTVVTGATTKMYTGGTDIRTSGRASISAATVCQHIEAGGGVSGVGGGGVGAGVGGAGAGGGVVNVVAKLWLSPLRHSQQIMLNITTLKMIVTVQTSYLPNIEWYGA